MFKMTDVEVHAKKRIKLNVSNGADPVKKMELKTPEHKISLKKTTDLRKYILYTDRDPENWRFYKLQESCDWSAREFDFDKEKNDYLSARPSIQKLIKFIFGFFLIGDGLISDEVIRFLKEAIQEENWPLVFYLSMQLKVENTHAETYSKAALTIIPQDQHKDIIDMCVKLDCIKKKGEWTQNFIDSSESKALRYVSCAVSEGVHFVSLFAVIFYMRKLGIFNNFIESNEQISKDESLHRDQKCMEAKRILTKEEWPRAIEIIKSGVDIEKLQARELLKEPIISEQTDKDVGLTVESLDLYIEMLADQVSVLCGMEKIYGSEAELHWMDDINRSQKTNFYERDVVGSYRKFDPNTALDEAENEGYHEAILNPEDVDI